ncbi:hypothetical protein Nepgr_010164 [Nepenthes gracilis]|uniref:Cullin family profile domain-containing protein n=1 Tax=Nepenthes gracilis TaxID=150966 RepID=A0AAD3XL20_NEPGR|nr:hypothetical protein Nepgr_010164 [Nepenthes gracilis]
MLSFKEYIESTVLPSLREKHNESMLREPVKRWQNHKVMVRHIKILHYLDCYFIAVWSLPPLNEVGLTCFRDSKVQHELLMVYATQLLEKEQSGCQALLRDDKVDNWSRIYVENVQHVTAEGTALVILHATIRRRRRMWLVFTNRFIGFRLLELLHWRHLVFCDKGVPGSSSLEILATFSNNIMKKHGSEKLTDEAIEETLEKVVKLLACVSDKDLFAEFYGCIEVSRDFYQTKTMHRKLTWIYSFGTCNINGKFEPKTMELIVTTYRVRLA